MCEAVIWQMGILGILQILCAFITAVILCPLASAVILIGEYKLGFVIVWKNAFAYTAFRFHWVINLATQFRNNFIWRTKEIRSGIMTITKYFSRILEKRRPSCVGYVHVSRCH